jgi:hypothetical protein
MCERGRTGELLAAPRGITIGPHLIAPQPLAPRAFGSAWDKETVLRYALIPIILPLQNTGEIEFKRQTVPCSVAPQTHAHNFAKQCPNRSERSLCCLGTCAANDYLTRALVCGIIKHYQNTQYRIMPVKLAVWKSLIGIVALTTIGSLHADETMLPTLPAGVRLAFHEDWSAGHVDKSKWYMLRKRWGQGNNGVTPDNVAIKRDTVNGTERNVLVCEAHGGLYQGAVTGAKGEKTRVGGAIATKEFFASGRYEVVMKVGTPGGDGAAAQLTLGVWLPGWGGPAPWQTAQVSFGPVKIWQYDDPGDVRGILTEDVPPNY